MIDFERLERHYFNHCDASKTCTRDCMFRKASNSNARNCKILKYVPAKKCGFFKQGNADTYKHFMRRTEKEIRLYSIKRGDE